MDSDKQSVKTDINEPAAQPLPVEAEALVPSLVVQERTDSEIIAQPFETRAEQLLSYVFDGMHHVDSLKKVPSPHPRWTCLQAGELSTYDFDTLTRLVIGAHYFCLRVSVSNGGPRVLKITLHERKGREGSIYERHPTLGDAIKQWEGEA